MKLSKSNALFLYSVLYHYRSQNDQALDNENFENLETLQETLKSFILDENVDDLQEEGDLKVASDDEDGEEEDEEDEVGDESSPPEFEDYLLPSVVADLPPITVVSPTGAKITLEFEDVEEMSSVDALLDGGSIIIDTVTAVKVDGDTQVSLWDGGEWHSFKPAKKLPRAWHGVFESGVTYGLDATEEEEK
jgi:hypothetical protein